MANWTANSLINSLLQGNRIGNTTINYFLDPVGGAWTAAEAAGFAAATASWSSVANITWTRVFTAGEAHFIEQKSTQAALGGGGTLADHGSFVDYTTSTIVPVTINGTTGVVGGQLTGRYATDVDGWDATGVGIGGEAYTTLVHELGHGLGLDHTHSGGAGDPHIFPGVGTDDQAPGENALNDILYSVMSYQNGPLVKDVTTGVGTNSYGTVGGPMAIDIAAIQFLYGANTTTGAGNSTYALPDANATGTYWLAIWDVSGIDSITYGGALAATIDLRAATLQNAVGGGGFASQVAGIFGGFTIASGVVIENGTGGSGDDTITGNLAANTLTGNLGSDTLTGADGDDMLVMGASAAGNLDRMSGGNGDDTADFKDFGSGVWVSLGFSGVEAWTRDNGSVFTAGTWRSIADLDTIENVIGTNAVDDLIGDQGDNTFGYRGTAAFAGTEKINGMGGLDTADFSGFGSGVWVSLGFSGTEAWTRDTGNLTTGTWRGIADLSGIENLVGTNGLDHLIGDGNNNTLFYQGSAVSPGTDTMDGGLGVDTADFSRFGSAVWVNLSSGIEAWTRDGANVATGTWRSIADLSGIENVTGTDLVDELIGNGSNNVFGYRGSAANPGIEKINGGLGTDTADFSAFESAVWIDLAFTGSQGWTRDGANVTAGTWRAISSLSSIENVTGTAGVDDLRGTDGSNTFGYVGSREITGIEQIDGRAGTDTVTFGSFTSAVWVNLSSATEAWTRDEGNVLTGTWRGIANITGVENVTGTNLADQLFGNGGVNVLRGGFGDDELTGAGGDDVFEFENNWGVDTIKDFHPSDGEKIDLSQVFNITSFTDLTTSHLRAAADGTAEIFDGANVIKLAGITAADVGAGMPISDDDFLF